MKRFNQLISAFCIALILAGCGAKATPDIKLPEYKCDFAFDGAYTRVYCSAEKQTVCAINKYDNAAKTVYDTLSAKDFTPIEKPDGFDDEKKKLSVDFTTQNDQNTSGQTVGFLLCDNDTVCFKCGDKTTYFAAKSDTYTNVEKQIKALIAKKNALFKENTANGKTSFSLLASDGSVLKEFTVESDNTRTVLYGEKLLLIEDLTNKKSYYYSADNGIVSVGVNDVCDYCDGYICYADGKEIKLINIKDGKFAYTFNFFEKPLSEKENPFVSVCFVDVNNIEIKYHISDESVFTQTADISPFYKDYESKKKETAESAPKNYVKNKGINVGANYKYDPPSTNTSDGIPPFTEELDARVLAYANNLSGYGWKGSENRQSYYSQFNAFATGDRTKNVVYLTFDEGYEYNENTNKILDILAQKGVKAVFFVTMDFAKKRPDLVRRMINEGHIVGNHSTTHPTFPKITTRKAYDEIKTLHDYILTNFGYNMSLFRFPEGAASDRMLALVKEMGYCTVFWNCAYNDWNTSSQPSQSTTRALIRDNTQNGTIYLFHAVSNTNVSMLAEIIDTVRAGGYEFGLFGK